LTGKDHFICLSRGSDMSAALESLRQGFHF